METDKCTKCQQKTAVYEDNYKKRYCKACHYEASRPHHPNRGFRVWKRIKSSEEKLAEARKNRKELIQIVLQANKILLDDGVTNQEKLNSLSYFPTKIIHLLKSEGEWKHLRIDRFHKIELDMLHHHLHYKGDKYLKEVRYRMICNDLAKAFLKLYQQLQKEKFDNQEEKVNQEEYEKIFGNQHQKSKTKMREINQTKKDTFNLMDVILVEKPLVKVESTDEESTDKEMENQ